MNQRAPHSNLPKFGVTKSQTSAILYQEPTSEEINPPSKPWVERFKNFSATALVAASLFGFGVVILKGCSDNVGHQQAMAVKHQLQFGGVK